MNPAFFILAYGAAIFCGIMLGIEIQKRKSISDKKEKSGTIKKCFHDFRKSDVAEVDGYFTRDVCIHCGRQKTHC